MFNVRIRQAMYLESCGVEGCPVEVREDLVVLEDTGRDPPLLLEMCGCCAAIIGDTLMAEARRVDLRRQRRLAGESI